MFLKITDMKVVNTDHICSYTATDTYDREGGNVSKGKKVILHMNNKHNIEINLTKKEYRNLLDDLDVQEF